MLINCGKGISIDVDVNALTKHQSVADHVWRIGLRNILMDCHANVTEEKFPGAAQTVESKRRVEEKLAEMIAGELTVKDGRTKAPKDPIAAQAFNDARDTINALVKGWNAKTRDETATRNIVKLGAVMVMPFGTDDEVKSLIAAAITKRAARADVIEKAAKTVAEQAAIDLGDLI